MSIIAVDLGTTNIKVCLFDDSLRVRSMENEAVVYIRSRNFVEFDAESYCGKVLRCIRSCVKNADGKSGMIHQIVFTGQAESLVVLGPDTTPLRNGISWIDTRSEAECMVLSAEFPEDMAYPVTGQPSIIPTWPITKVLWLRNREPETFRKAWKYLLLKDYILFRLTGRLCGEFSIYNFSHYFNIHTKRYWREILDFCEMRIDQLPELIEPQTVIGQLTGDAADSLGLSIDTKINAGTLDHFAGMIGTGNIQEGIISESTGTVLSIATMVHRGEFTDAHIPLHYGPFQDSYVYLPVCESGGISLEWFKKEFLREMSYEQLNAELSMKKLPGDLFFLPYLTGVNAPDYNMNARGVFFGLQIHHDRTDLAQAVMEGVAHLLRKNISLFEQAGVKATNMISTGGGARSDYWSQIKADITGYSVSIPENEEAATLGAAIIGAISEGFFPSFQDAISSVVSMKRTFLPRDPNPYEGKHKIFDLLYSQLGPVFEIADK